MSKVSISRLDILKAQAAKLAVQIQTTEGCLKTSEGKQEMRRKILIGSYSLEETRKNNILVKRKATILKFLNCDGEKALYE